MNGVCAAEGAASARTTATKATATHSAETPPLVRMHITLYLARMFRQGELRQTLPHPTLLGPALQPDVGVCFVDDRARDVPVTVHPNTADTARRRRRAAVQATAVEDSPPARVLPLCHTGR